MKNFIIIATAAVLFTCCNQSTNNQSVSKNADVSKVRFETQTEFAAISSNFENYTLRADKGEQITTQNGTRILIAPGTFVTASGKAVEGPVNVSYKGINSVAEIVASGIPMQAVHNGEIGQFVSDGMFEINASANGEVLKIAEGKSIQVFTKSRDKESDFQYWYFNQAKGAWDEIGTRNELADDNSISENIKEMGINANTGITAGNLRWINKQQHLFRTAASNSDQKEIVPNKVIPGKYDPKKMTLDLNFNAASYPELAAYSSLMWQFAGTDANMDPARNNWIFQSAWNNVKLDPIADKPGLFSLEINSGGQIFRTIVRPVVSGKDLETAESDYAQELKKLEDLRKQQLEQGANTEQISANLYNAFRVSKMGVYNCDRFYSDKAAEEYTASFKMDGKTLDPNRMIYILTDNRKGVIQYTASTYQLKLNPKTVDAIFTVAANGAIAAASASSLGHMKESRGGRVDLVFEKVKVKINSLGSLKEAIESI